MAARRNSNGARLDLPPPGPPPTVAIHPRFILPPQRAATTQALLLLKHQVQPHQVNQAVFTAILLQVMEDTEVALLAEVATRVTAAHHLATRGTAAHHLVQASWAQARCARRIPRLTAATPIRMR
jgi:hypothetical protein